MSRIFSVGELAIAQHGTYYASLDGALVVVTRGLAVRNARDMVKNRRVLALCYGVKILVTPSVSSLARPHQLRPLKGEPERSLPRVEEEPVT